MMGWKWGYGPALALAVLGSGAADARAQGVGETLNNPVYAAPGNYGTSWGTASYGLKRSYSEFSSPYGPGYAYGLAPYGVLPGPYGAGLWRAGQPAGSTLYGGPNAYRTFAVPFDPRSTAPTPRFGAYAPAFGPSYPGW